MSALGAAALGMVRGSHRKLTDDFIYHYRTKELKSQLNPDNYSYKISIHK